MLEEALSVGDRALIFTQFAEMGHMLRAHLQTLFGVEVLFLHGGTPQKQRERMVARFQACTERSERDERDGPPIFLLSLKAGGTGLNLRPPIALFASARRVTSKSTSSCVPARWRSGSMS
jgi:SNF2 family DNA or RNA helicase